MSRIHSSLRATIARNIRKCRLEKFPEYGGSGKCAAKFFEYTGKKFSHSQWSSWETGGRTPNEESLQKIAEFFKTTIDYMLTDHRLSASTTPTVPPYEPADSSYVSMPVPRLIVAMENTRPKSVYEVEISIEPLKFMPFNMPDSVKAGNVARVNAPANK